ncbi:UNVERIFIED_CONTAM: hypothetical protein GTU68_059424 [Idotea baltica]|nr:hypothetical protein [Idotea baltica]
MSTNQQAKTLYEKVYDAHVAVAAKGETPILYIDRHLVHEVTSPQAFDGLREKGRKVRQVGKTFATMDHNVSTQTKDINASGEMARIQMETLSKNCEEFGVTLYDLNHKYQGIVHVMGPELGITLPGMTIVCGDSHTATHGAFGSLAFGIGTSEVEHVLATQTLKQAADIKPQVTWGTNPGQVISVDTPIPAPESFADPVEKASAEKALAYMGLEAGKSLSDYNVDKVFVGSCTNSRIEDMRAAAAVAKGRQVAKHVQALIVPGSEQVKAQAEAEGLDKIFIEAGFEWRLPGCSMCLAMNNDRLGPQERCASTSNRNFEGRQGRDGRTHLVSPAMAAAAAIAGHFVDIREL